MEWKGRDEFMVCTLDWDVEDQGCTSSPATGFFYDLEQVI